MRRKSGQTIGRVKGRRPPSKTKEPAPQARKTGSGRLQGRIRQENNAQIGYKLRPRGEPIASSQAPRAEERLAAVLQPPEQWHRLGLVELSRLTTSTPIGAVVVEVQTEEELAVQAACGREIREVIRSAEKKQIKA